MFSISLGGLLKALPPKKVAVFLLDTTADLLEHLDPNTAGIDDQGARVLKQAASILRDIKTDEQTLSKVASEVKNIPALKDSPSLSESRPQPEHQKE
jgi:uncharacterized protein YoxC